MIAPGGFSAPEGKTGTPRMLIELTCKSDPNALGGRGGAGVVLAEGICTVSAPELKKYSCCAAPNSTADPVIWADVAGGKFAKFAGINAIVYCAGNGGAPAPRVKSEKKKPP